MKKVILFIGIGIFILGILAFFLSGSQSGASPEEMKPTVSFLYGTNQLYWIAMSIIGVVTIVIGAFLKKEKEVIQ